MAEHQSAESSLMMGETDEEKSVESNEDMFSMHADMDQDLEDNNHNKNDNDNDNDNSDNEKDADNDNDDDNRNNNSDNEKDDDNQNRVRRSSRKIGDTNNKKTDDEHEDDDDENENENETDTNNKGTNDDEDDDDESKTQRKKIKKLPTKKNLNQPTLEAMEKYLKSGKFFDDSLEYEEVGAFASKIHRYTVERTRLRRGLIFQDGAIENGDDPNADINPIIITAEDAADELLYNQVYQREEFYAVATEFSKTMRRQERLDKETENFRILADVVGDLEKQSGAVSEGRSKKGNKLGTGSVSPLTIDGGAAAAEGDDDDDGDVGMMDAIPEEIVDVTPESFPSLESTGLTQIGSNNIYKGSTIAALATYMNSNQSNQKDDDDTMMVEKEKESSQQIASEYISLPPPIAKLGLEFRPQLLKLKEVSKTPRNIQQKQDKDVDAPKKKNYSDDLYVKNCKTLMNTLSNKHARNWAVHEFFYSDMDREWYQNDGFISELAKLGLPITSKTRLTKQEWSLVRCKLRSRPRLFSKRFIADQIKKRNRHRNLIRKLQQDPDITEFSPIPIGTVVTAYHKHGCTICQGRVLFHDLSNHNYLVQFDDEEFGCEICTASGGRTESIEREILVSLLAAIKEGFERKENILKALDSCSENPGVNASKHISWLLANLDRSNSTLQKALTHLQVLYGVTYENAKSEEDENVERMKLRNEYPDNKSCQELVASLTSMSEKVGELIFSDNDASDEKQKNESSKLQKDLAGSASLLVLANYLAESSSLESDKAAYSSTMDAVLKSSLDKYANICLAPTSETLLIGQKLENESQIENELKHLADAVGMLRAEVAIATDENRTFEHTLCMGNN
ncbi:hypothetical protein FRACYDRAFT_239438 [Fragilariopsis cylindrus CCMP1102]|uniref:DIRP domain-containing protein n=1 Tax=Fragilariopsis cylindrus CCMP1102 TaxID=635003 RepID=A0A1E7FFM1_9STRA|nr:hypothetical protein FRACYDRAFT_239438 [Fragilariopsis cylindrus CCMP1102]|eukprot:OEU16845.1 hypothetical protein FRACYDRAFT_239438 [Fragilariopsis cylindrus CCMP1102]